MFWGNKQVKNFFEQAIAKGNLAQVYCLTGVDQVGKRTLSFFLSSQLFQVPLEKVAFHPDFFFLNRGIDEKTGKERKEISVGQIRGLRSFLQNQSWQGGWRIVVIDEAEFLNEESGNALLKNLEEPGEKTLIFLLTNNEEQILPTIRSRVQTFRLNIVDDWEIKNGLLDLGCDANLAERIVYLSSGRPGRAIDFFRDEEKLKEWEEETRRWQEIIKKPLYERIKILENIIPAKDELVRTENRLQKILNIWLEEVRRMLITNMQFDSDKLMVWVQVADALSEAQVMLEQNINPKMVMEKIMLQF